MKVLFLLLLFSVTINAKVRYDNYTLYKILPKDVKQIEILRSLEAEEDKYDFWTDPVPYAEFVNILTSPPSKRDLESFLSENNVKFEIAMENIQEAIDKEIVQSYTRANTREMKWDAYYKLEGIHNWLDDLAEAHDSVTVVIGGSSYEGREIKGIKISHGAGKKAVFLEGGIHAREWISPATLCFIANELLTSDNEEVQAAARDFDWYIFPVTNPDGYVFTTETNRMWRKNRRPFGSNYGVDLNRNWNSNWLVAGASSNPASDTYAGPGPFSEVESRTLSEFINSIGSDIDLYLSFHSYGQLLLIPYGNSTTPYSNYHDAMNIGRRAMGALSVRYGTQYTTGNVAEAIYFATGSSMDWVKDQHKVPLVYCYELRDKGATGFILPPTQISPTGLETLDSILDIIHQARRFGYMNSNGNSAKITTWLIAFMVLFKVL